MTTDPRQLYSNKSIVSSLKAAHRKLGHSPRPSEYETLYLDPKYPKICVSRTTVRRRYNGNWNEALEAADLPLLEENNLLNIARCLIAATKLNGHVPNTSEYTTLYRKSGNGVFISQQTIVGTFGSWTTALEFAGLEPGPTCRAERFSKSVSPESPASQRQKRTQALKRRIQELSSPRFADERGIAMLLLIHEADGFFLEAVSSARKGEDIQNVEQRFRSALQELRKHALEMVE